MIESPFSEEGGMRHERGYRCPASPTRDIFRGCADGDFTPWRAASSGAGGRDGGDGFHRAARRSTGHLDSRDQARRGRQAFDFFLEAYGAKYDNAVACPARDRDVLLAFYDFSAEHWKHIRTANPTESTFAAVRLRTTKTKGCLSRMTALTMVFKLCQSASKRWRHLDDSLQIAGIIEGVKFTDGEKLTERAA